MTFLRPLDQILPPIASIYRDLLSILRKSKSEAELASLVTENLLQHFPGHRVTISVLQPDGKVFPLHSQGSDGSALENPRSFDLSPASEVWEAFRQGRALATPDVRKEKNIAPILAELLEIDPNTSRIDIPFALSEQKAYLLSLTHSTRKEWSGPAKKVLQDFAEFLGFMFRDVLSREDLQKTETLFRQFAENVQVVFWMSDLDKGEIIYVSPAYEIIWGRTTKSIYETPLSFVHAIHPEDRPRVEAAVRRQAEGKYEQFYRVVRPDGEVRWVKDRAFVIRDEEGVPFRIAGIAEDVTPLREAQLRLEASQAQVVSATKFAALGEMASGVAHEINNPLAVIHGLSVQLQEIFQKRNEDNPIILENLASIEKMANRIAGIVKGLRTFSRQTQGDPLLASDLKGIVQETLAIFRTKLRSAEIKLELEVPEHPILIRCRSSEISQVLLNLLNNAHDAAAVCPKGEIKVSVRRDAGTVYLMVKDNGPGISNEVRERIFQPFFTTKEVGRGTGLGLPISKGIVEAHGGRLFLDSTARETTFVVELPMEKT